MVFMCGDEEEVRGRRIKRAGSRGRHEACFSG